MKQDEIVIGQKYLFINNGQHEHKKNYHNQIVVVLGRIKGKTNTKEYYVNRRGKKPDKFLLDVGIYANAANLKNVK